MQNRPFLLAAAVVGLIVTATYSNHFHNSFHFDDFHTITQNSYIHDLSNVPRFFSSARTFSVRPDHGSYRPVVSSSLALDMKLSKGSDPFWFHLSTFVWFLIQLALMHKLFQTLMDRACPNQDSRWFALFAAALYGLHPVSAETVNYIIQRAEIFCTVGVLAGLVIYIRFPNLRRTGLYLVPVVVGILAKVPAALFAGLLFVYILLFEEDGNLLKSLRRTLPALIACFSAGALVLRMEAGTFVAGGSDPLMYRLIQPYVIWHYFTSFFWPVGLSADSDMRLAAGWTDARVAFGILFVLTLITASWFASRRRETRPIAFGLAWFLMTLLPVSWVALAEIENDHRMYFPFVGLTLAVIWSVRLLAGDDLRSLAVAGTMVLAVCAYGTRQRNEIWRSEETLWRDVVIQSPGNGRGKMNYGLTLMSKGDVPGALALFEDALRLTPTYPILHINLAIAYGALGRSQQAEQEFSRAQFLAPDDSESYYYYARWLAQNDRKPQAIAMLQTGVQKNAADQLSRNLLAALCRENNEAAKSGQPLTAMETVATRQESPTAESLLSTSLQYYQAGRYKDCIAAARQAVRLKPDFAEAYNNIAAGANAIGAYEEGIQAAAEAIRLKPNFTLAQNNLAWAQTQFQRSHKR